MRPRMTAVLLSLLLIQGCSLGKLKREIERADKTYSYLKIAPVEATNPDGRVIVAVYQDTASGPQLINYRVPTPGDASFFLLPIADYIVVAFEDLNRDFIYQPR